MNRAARIWAHNHHLLAVVMNDCSEQLSAIGLETKEFFVLGEIDAFPFPAELAARLMLPKPSVTVYLRNLVAKEFIRREIDEDDLRRHRLVLTRQGRRALDSALSALSRSFESRLARLEASERAELERLLEKLI